MKLNVKNVRLWIRALKSGEFQQATGTLRNTEHFQTGVEFSHCCLGVACELYSQKVAGFFNDEDDFISDFRAEKNRVYADYEGEYDEFRFVEVSNTNMLTPQVAEWLGLSEKVQEVLADINDSGGTFADISIILRSALAHVTETGRSPSLDWWKNRKYEFDQRSFED